MEQTPNSNSQDDCPICMDQIKLCVETNCGHLYCSGCMLTNWNKTFGASPMTCPICRQNVTILLPVFTEHESNTTNLSTVRERQNQVREIHQYNQMYSGMPRPWFEKLKDIPVTLRHMWAELLTLHADAMNLNGFASALGHM